MVPSGTPMLEIEGLHVKYGGIHALKGISVNVEEMRIVTLLGANGAGKTTTIKAVSGMVPITAGDVRFLGRSLKNMPAHAIQKLGLVHIPEGRKIFANLTVRENLIMGAYNNSDKKDVARTMDRIFAAFPILEMRSDQLGGTLSGGEQQMLAIGRAMMSRPKLLMMDEPSLGLAPQLVAEVFEVIRRIHEAGTTILLIEQNAWGALEVADYAYVLENGRMALEGKGPDLLANDAVRQAYLGEG
jgi:branched-chain amino acid transport system ATP-binding protein